MVSLRWRGQPLPAWLCDAAPDQSALLRNAHQIKCPGVEAQAFAPISQSSREHLRFRLLRQPARREEAL